MMSQLIEHLIFKRHSCAWECVLFDFFDFNVIPTVAAKEGPPNGRANFQVDVCGLV